MEPRSGKETSSQHSRPGGARPTARPDRRQQPYLPRWGRCVRTEAEVRPLRLARLLSAFVWVWIGPGSLSKRLLTFPQPILTADNERSQTWDLLRSPFLLPADSGAWSGRKRSGNRRARSCRPPGKPARSDVRREAAATSRRWALTRLDSGRARSNRFC